MLLSGCFAFVPGRGVLGGPMGAAERDRAVDSCEPVFYLWTEVPDPRPRGWSAPAFLVNALGSLVLLPISFFALPVLLLGCDDDCDDRERRRYLPPETEERLNRGLERDERERRAREGGAGQ